MRVLQRSVTPRAVKRRRTDRGATAVEFALVLLPLTLILFGIVQYGYFFFASQSASAAAREAARQLSVGNCQDANPANPADLKTYVSGLVAGASLGNLNVKYSDPGATAPATLAVGDQVTVTVSFKTLDLHFPFIPVPEVAGDATVAKAAAARVEDTSGNGGCPS